MFVDSMFTIGLSTDNPALFSKLIAKTAKDIDVLIESLPSEESSLELQVRFYHSPVMLFLYCSIYSSFCAYHGW